ncbi:hypothetical protein FQA39_LY00250 [Lamprigera yunnana]|nr:hypothetical protein FQA39_LY00250 [Lamprigera yunnana]
MPKVVIEATEQQGDFDQTMYNDEEVQDKMCKFEVGTESSRKCKCLVEKCTLEPEANLDCAPISPKFEIKTSPEHESNYNSNCELEPTSTDQKTEPPKKVIGFARGLKPKEILAATNSTGQLLFLMKWDEGDKADIVPAVEANLRCPEVVINFYEKHTSHIWQNVSITNKSLTILNIHAPLENEEIKDKFDKELEDACRSIPKLDIKMVIADYNAKPLSIPPVLNPIPDLPEDHMQMLGIASNFALVF